MLSYSTALRNGPPAVMDTRPLVIVVDDDLSTREGLEALLDSAGMRVRAFGSATEFLAWTPPAGPACLLLDISLPDFNGLDIQAQVAGERPEIPIIFITGYGDIPMTVRAMKAGAAEFLTKPLAEEVLLAAVERAVETSRRAIEEKADLAAITRCYASLSPRERQVMALVVSGLLNKQVGWELGISEITVKAHRGRVMEKMSAGSFADLVKMSERLEIEMPPPRDSRSN
jgi:FixJ family two-component response regulator